MKQFLRYTLTLVAILIATTNAWAATETWNGGVAVGAGKGSATVELYNDGLLSDTQEETKTSKSSTVASFSKTETTSIFNLSIDKRYMKFTATKAEGYEFAGWFSDAACTQSHSTANPYQTSSNNKSLTLTLYAKFTPHTYTVTYNGNGATNGSMSSQTLVFDQTEKLNANQYARTYTITYNNDGAISTTTATATYGGWSTNADGTGTSYTDQANMRNFLISNNNGTLNLYAKWILANITLPSPIKEGYILEGWYNGNTKVGNAGDEITPTSDITLTANWIQKYTPIIQGTTEITMLVDDTKHADYTFEKVSQAKPSENSGNFYYTITHSPDNTSKEGSPNRNLVISYDPSTNKIIALNSGTATITFIQEETDTYYTDTLRSTIIVSKNTSYFTLNFANEYFVDDQIAKSTFLVSPTNTEVAISVTDNKGYFSYTNDNLIANCPTSLPADYAQTTITVTQPENYKWTSYSLNKTVTVKKYPTEFNWLLTDTYYVDDVITSVFTKSNNSLSSTITSSDPNIVKVEGNQLKALNAGKVTITATQAVDRKWVAFTQTKEITVKKHDIVATITPDNAYWNEWIPNPFAATSTHPATGQVTTIDDFIVAQQGNEHIALMDANSRNIQTYYTNGDVNFLITRPEDYKYNALNQPLTLTVNASTESCDIFTDPTERNFSTGITDFSGKAGYAYEIPENVRAYADSVYITAKRNGENYFYLQYSTNGGTQWTDFPEGLLNLSTSYKTFGLKIPEGKIVTHIRPFAKTGATLRKDHKDFRVTRKEKINPSIVEGETLKLPTVAFGKPSSNTFTLDWSTCSDIKIESSNSKFTIGTTPENASKVFNLPDADGNQTFTIYCNTSEIGIYTGTITIYNQSRKVSFNVTDTVNDKWTPVMTGEESYSKKVGNTWTTNFTFKNTETATPSADKSAPFYFEIDHKSFVNTDRLTRNPNHLDEVISYNPDTYEITAHNAGTAVLTFVQQGNDGYYYSSRSCTITIDKNTPTFTWKDPIYFNQTISDYFTTNNNPNENEYATEVSITQESTDPDVAIIYFNQEDDTDKHSLDLTTYYKETTPESSTQVTVYQAENWYWNAKEEPHTITPKNKNNHVSNTPITETNLNDFKIEYQDPWNNPWTNDGIHFGEPNIGGDDGGWNWNDKYIIIEFTGVPDSLFFTTATTGTAGMDNPLDAGDNATNNKFFYVSAGTSKDNLREIWSSTSQTNTYKEKLDPSVRFLKLCYTGNLEGWFKNVRITELNQFEATPAELDFETLYITDTPSKTMTFDLNYANAGHKVVLELDRTGTLATEEEYQRAHKYITIQPTSIGNIGGEYVGSVEDIQVILSSPDQTGYDIPEDARIKISDEAGNTTYVALKGNIAKSTQTITWNDYFSLQEPIQIPISTDTIRNAATATCKLPVKYRSDNEAVIKINEDSLSFYPVGIGTATITAYQTGNEQYAYVEDTKQVQVTEKSIQLIDWRDDLSDLILRDNADPIALTAKVYIIDVVNSTFEYSEEQTAKLVYTVNEGGESIISIEGTTLTLIGLGETTLSVTIAADDSHEGATMTIPVIVREPAIGCEDELLLDQTAPTEIFTEGMNTNQVIKPAIPIDRSKGVPGYLKFEHKGEYWKLTGLINYYAGTIKAQQSTDGGSNWTDVPGSEIKPTVGTYNPTSLLPIDRNATHIRFVRPSGGQGYHYYRNVQVYPAQYLETNTTEISYGDINMGGKYDTKKFTISYSNIKSPLMATTSSKDVTVSPSYFGDCGDFGTQEIQITWQPSTQQNQYIIFQDTLADLSIRVDLNANIQLYKQKIVWENRPKAILDHTGIDNRPLYTRDANSNEELTDLPITYEVIGSDSAYFENGMFFIINTDTINIKASSPGNNKYLAVDSIYQIIIQGIPPTFVGNTAEGADSLWTTRTNWVNEVMPTDDRPANIVAPVQINTEINVQGVRVAESGSIHITSTGGLTVGEGGIQTVTTDGSAIVIDNLHSGAGFFRINPNCEDELPRITMRYQTKSTLDNGANKDAEWQYIGAPGEDASVHVDYNTWLYRLDESQADWVLMPQHNNHTLSPFQGYALTQYGQPTYEWNAQMINRNCTIPLTYHFDGRKGQNLIANSYTAPIDVTQMRPEDFQMSDGQSEYYDITQTLYLYNSGSWKDWHTHDSVGISSDGNNTTPGQYYAIPVLAVAEGYIPERPTIAPMQGIYVRVRAKKTGGDTHVGHIIFNYDRIVMGEGHDMHRPMRAPKKSDIASIPSENFRRLRIVATSEHSGADRLYIIQDDINTRNYDNGYDAPNQATQGIVNIYTYESGGKMEVSCANNIDSTYIGFMAGEDRTYTLHFNAIIGETLYLQDLVSGEKIYIVEDGTYTFEAEPQSTNNKRFLLHAKRAINSDMEDVNAAHIWFSNHTLYVTNATDNSLLQLYDVSGHMIFSSIIHRTPYTVDLTHLTEGVYMARLNNQVYKFVCK